MVLWYWDTEEEEEEEKFTISIHHQNTLESGGWGGHHERESWDGTDGWVGGGQFIQMKLSRLWITADYGILYTAHSWTLDFREHLSEKFE